MSGRREASEAAVPIEKVAVFLDVVKKQLESHQERADRFERRAAGLLTVVAGILSFVAVIGLDRFGSLGVWSKSSATIGIFALLVSAGLCASVFMPFVVRGINDGELAKVWKAQKANPARDYQVQAQLVTDLLESSRGSKGEPIPSVLVSSHLLAERLARRLFYAAAAFLFGLVFVACTAVVTLWTGPGT